MNPAVNAVVAMDMERARAEATAADNSRAAGDHCGPLHGLPMTIKDCYETLDLVTSCGRPGALRAHADARRRRSAVAPARRSDCVGQDQSFRTYAGDHQTYNDVYGITNNPWDLTRTSGGSSGGALPWPSPAVSPRPRLAATSATRSVSRPVLNGVFGLKTTHGLVSGRGHIPGPTGSLTSSDLGRVRTARSLVRRSPNLARGVDQLRFGVWRNAGCRAPSVRATT